MKKEEKLIKILEKIVLADLSEENKRKKVYYGK